MSRVRHLMGDTPFSPPAFFGCRPPVLRQHIHRNKSPSLKSNLQILSKKTPLSGQGVSENA
jgi:hypothetical protein